MRGTPARDETERIRDWNGQGIDTGIKASRGRLLHEIPPERFRLAREDSARPQARDIVGLDRGFTGDDEEPMTLVYGFDNSGEQAHEAELYDFDFEVVAHE